MPQLTRRRFAQLAGLAAAGTVTVRRSAAATPDESPDVSLEIAPYLLEASPKHRFHTVAYNGQVPGRVLRLREGQEAAVRVTNRTADPEIVHWHGLSLPPEVDGAMEEGTPMIPPGASADYRFTPEPAGARWYHTHTFAGADLKKGQYSGQHGFLMIEPRDHPGRYDREVFLVLHDFGARMAGGGDGSMSPEYECSTVNGKMLGFEEPVQVKQGERILVHVLNCSPTEVHWVALSGHTFRVVALDGNDVPAPRSVPMLRLAPAERVSATVEMNAPGVWVFGEVRKHIQAAGMGIVFEYANATGAPRWNQPQDLVWNYEQFASIEAPPRQPEAIQIELAFQSRFKGHGSEEQWLINGKSYPQTDEPVLRQGQRYRLMLKNLSLDDHPLHLHRHAFEVRRILNSGELYGLRKDVVLAPAGKTTEVEFVADHPGRTLFHCHQQDHMDRGFMMVFRYA